DSFQLELQESREGRELRICRHSIPPFIPLEPLCREFLPGKLPKFLALLCQHLNAFVGRRHQLQTFQVSIPKLNRSSPNS
ncbi:CENPO protein, partial [Peucedramus taeniatus]|nr:CENPO protein [Peucedramus taeniatus]